MSESRENLINDMISAINICKLDHHLTTTNLNNPQLMLSVPVCENEIKM